MMKTAIAVAALALSASAEHVVVGTDANWAETVAAHDLVLVEFYAPWCGHCKQLTPKYEEAAKILSELEKPIPLVKVDGTEEKVNTGKAGVSGYPTMKVYRKGEMSDYDGARETDGIVSYMKEQSVPPTIVVEEAATLKKTLSRKQLNETVVVGYFSSKTSADFKIFTAVANKYRGKFKFYEVTDQSILEAVGFYGSANAVALLRPWSGSKGFKQTYNGVIYKDKLQNWVVDNAFPPVGLISRDDMAFFYEKEKPMLFAYVPEEDEAKDALVKDHVKALAASQKEFAKKLLFVVNDFGADTYQFAEGADKAGTALVITDGRKIYKYDAKFGSPAEWVKLWVEKKAEQWLKTEAPVEKAAKDEVQVITGGQFDEFVIDSKENVFLELYAPWCGHCKRLAPVWDELAKKTADMNVVIAKMDATANDVKHSAFEAKGYPTLMLARKGDKLKPMSYSSGERTVEDLLEWLKETIPEDEEL